MGLINTEKHLNAYTHFVAKHACMRSRESKFLPSAVKSKAQRNPTKWELAESQEEWTIFNSQSFPANDDLRKCDSKLNNP